jgi:hypothetical protein
MHCAENLKQIFPKIKRRGLVPNFYICERFIYCIPTIGPQTQYSKIGGPIVGMYKSLTEIHECRNWERGLAVSFLGIYMFRIFGTVNTVCYGKLINCNIGEFMKLLYEQMLILRNHVNFLVPCTVFAIVNLVCLILSGCNLIFIFVTKPVCNAL